MQNKLALGPSEPPHLAALDGLRGVAILLVLLIHVSQGAAGALAPYQVVGLDKAAFDLPWWLGNIANAGGNGVLLFFTISAFTLASRAPSTLPAAAFYAKRRLARVAPGYWLAGAAYLALAGLQPRLWAPDGVDAYAIASAATFLSAWTGGASLAVVPGGWSISCEVTFYAILPFLMMAVRNRLPTALSLFLALTAAPLWAKQFGLIDGSPFNPLFQAPAFLSGVIAMLAVTQRLVPRVPAGMLLFLVVCVVPQVFPGRYVPTFLFNVGAGVLVARAAANPSWLLTRPALVNLGLISYSLYLVHFALLLPSLRVAQWLQPGQGVLTFVPHFGLTLMASSAVAGVTDRSVERPINRGVRRKPGTHGFAEAGS